MSAPLWLKLVQGFAVDFLLGRTDACPLVGGDDSNPSGGWGLVSDGIRGSCGPGGSLGSLFTDGWACNPTWIVV